MVFRVLADLRIVRIADLSIVKEVIDDRADQHLKRSRGADACRTDDLRGNIGLKSGNSKALLPCSLCHACHQRYGTAVLWHTLQRRQVYYHLFLIAFTHDLNDIGAIRSSGSDRIQADARCEDLSAIVIRMIADDLGTARSREKLHLLFSKKLSKMSGKRLKACTALRRLTIYLLQYSFFRYSHNLKSPFPIHICPLHYKHFFFI